MKRATGDLDDALVLYRFNWLGCNEAPGERWFAQAVMPRLGQVMWSGLAVALAARTQSGGI